MSRLPAATLAMLVFAPQARADSFLAQMFTVQETGWLANAEVHRPRDHWNDVNRDITLMSLSAARSWEFRYGLETQLNAGIFGADGMRNELGWSAPEDSSTIGVNFGGGLRWYAFHWHSVSPFAEGYANVVYTPGNPFPAGGSGINGYLRAGAGARFDLSERYGLEAGYHLSHVSNGGGLVPGNPAYNGQGLFLNLRWRG